MADFRQLRERIVDGEAEQVLPAFFRPDGHSPNVEYQATRVARCALYIELGARRQVCRNFICSEEEFDLACKQAGRVPRADAGWWEPPADLERTPQFVTAHGYSPYQGGGEL